MDYQLAHALDSFSARHDAFEDPLRAYVGASEILFLVAVVALLLLVPGARRETARRAAVAAAAGAGPRLLLPHSSGPARSRPGPADPPLRRRRGRPAASIRRARGHDPRVSPARRRPLVSERPRDCG